MRTAILNYLKANKKSLTPLIISDNLPWEDNGSRISHHNKKHLYVDLDQVTQAPAFDTLNSKGSVDETTIVRAYFVTDAKQIIPNFESILQVIRDARLTTDITGVIQRTCQVTNTFNGDAIETTFEFSFRKLITN
jgi:hypothetical protein